MTTVLERPAARTGWLRDLDHPAQAFGAITPNWFAAVMGTGIVAVAASGLRDTVPGLRVAATLVWALAAVLLVALCAATAVHWLRFPDVARGHVRHPVLAHFYGAPPMALLTVGAGTLLVGRDVLGLGLAVDVDRVLWTAGTVGGLVVAVAVPWLLVRGRIVHLRDAFGGWLMPVVPPMVSASTGALLVPHTAAGAPRVALLLACYAMFALAAVASLIVIVLVCVRLVRRGPGEARSVPTVWIVLGPLGQSVTAVNLLGGVAHEALPHQAAALETFGLAYGVPVWIAALVWSGLAAAITVRTARTGLPFALTWWSFTFPVGTLVTATSGLALRTGSAVLAALAVVLFAGLCAAWATVAVRTARGCACGSLLLSAAR